VDVDAFVLLPIQSLWCCTHCLLNDDDCTG
jgi:hypothetical protein